MTKFLFFLMLFLMLFIIVMTIVISNNDDEFANLIKTFYECRNNNKSSELQKSLRKYNIHYYLGEKEIKSDYGSALIIPTFRDSVVINGTTYSVTKVIHDTDNSDIKVILK